MSQKKNICSSQNKDSNEVDYQEIEEERKKGRRIMSKEPTLEHVKKELEARTSEIKEEYERKIRELEEKIEKHKRERDARLIETEKKSSKDFGIAFKWFVGEEDYNWLCKWLMKNKEKKIEEAEKRHERKRADELSKTSVEEYLYYYFYNPEIEERLKKDMEQSKPEEVKRLSFILTKWRLEEQRIGRTRL